MSDLPFPESCSKTGFERAALEYELFCLGTVSSASSSCWEGHPNPDLYVYPDPVSSSFLLQIVNPNGFPGEALKKAYHSS